VLCCFSEFKHNQRWGHGTYTTSETSFTGEWKDDKQHGFGVLRGPTGEYKGHFEFDLPHGQGTRTWRDGSTYTGMYDRGMRQGQGVHSFAQPAGMVYSGAWVGDRRHGQGELRFPDHSRYNGGFEMDQQHGLGVFTAANGQQHQVRWERGVLIRQPTSPTPQQSATPAATTAAASASASPATSPDGRLMGPTPGQTQHIDEYQDGTVYVGEMASGRRHGWVSAQQRHC
jgi:hypothetical protein